MKNSKKNWIRQRNFQVRSLFSLKGAGYGNNTGQNHKTPTIPFVGVHEPGGGIPVCFNNGIIELFFNDLCIWFKIVSDSISHHI